MADPLTARAGRIADDLLERKVSSEGRCAITASSSRETALRSTSPRHKRSVRNLRERAHEPCTFGAARRSTRRSSASAGSRARLETPARGCSISTCSSAISRFWPRPAARRGCMSGPMPSHVNAPRSRDAQMAAGALGICCAKPGELLALFEKAAYGICCSALRSPARRRSRLWRARQPQAGGSRSLSIGPI